MEKQLIILAHYVNIGHVSPTKAKELMERTMEMVMAQDEDDPSYRFKHFFYPVKEEGHARTECIFPNNR